MKIKAVRYISVHLVFNLPKKVDWPFNKSKQFDEHYLVVWNVKVKFEFVHIQTLLVQQNQKKFVGDVVKVM